MPLYVNFCLYQLKFICNSRMEMHYLGVSIDLFSSSGLVCLGTMFHTNLVRHLSS